MAGHWDRCRNVKESNMDPAVFQSTIGLLVPLFAIALPIIIVAIVMYSRNVRSRQRHETIGRLIEKGLPVPPELLGSQHDVFATISPKVSPLRSAFTLMGLGVGLIIFFVAEGGDNWGIGAIPLSIGLAQLLAWKLEKPQSGAADSTPKE
jgi:hypothetical protein